jgi:hypothetical protein
MTGGLHPLVRPTGSERAYHRRLSSLPQSLPARPVTAREEDALSEPGLPRDFRGPGRRYRVRPRRGHHRRRQDHQDRLGQRPRAAAARYAGARGRGSSRPGAAPARAGETAATQSRRRLSAARSRRVRRRSAAAGPDRADLRILAGRTAGPWQGRSARLAFAASQKGAAARATALKAGFTRCLPGRRLALCPSRRQGARGAARQDTGLFFKSPSAVLGSQRPATAFSRRN